MNKPRSKQNLASAMIVAGLICVMLLACYGLGYIICDHGEIGLYSSLQCRMFPTQWQCTLFWPAAQLEAAWIGQPVMVYYVEGDEWLLYGVAP